MMSSSYCTKNKPSHSPERGAALITSLMVATLLLAAGGALILTTSTSTTTAIDATAEMQAYYGAEAGLQRALNILRGNVNPHDISAGTKITFRNAVTSATSNAPTDTAPGYRLSAWLQYDYTSAGSAYPDRVKVNPTDNTYSPLTGIAFTVTITDPDNTPVPNGDPTRLVIKSIGYGPKGSVKQLEMVVHRNFFNFALPAPLTVRGGGTGMTFNIGNSNASGYTGNDIHIPALSGLPAVAVTGSDLGSAQTVVDNLNAQGGGTQVTPSTVAALTSSNTPPFLATAKDARDFLVQTKDIADGDGRYFPTGAAAIAAGLGTSAAPLTTFIDNHGGDPVSLGPGYQGCGLLIVTGELITSGTTDFEGLILVLGTGVFNRNGNGNGHIDGGIIVASFDPSPTATTGFTSPTFSVNGAGNSDVRYNSDAVRKAFDSAGVFVAGIHEY